MEIHPLAERIPGMTATEYAAHVQSIRENGLLEAVTLYEGMVLDGRHRLRACGDLGIEPRFETYAGHSPVAFVLAKNVDGRRHLTSSQRAMIATDFLPDLEAEALSRKRTAGASAAPGRPAEKDTAVRREVSEGTAASQAAELVGASPRSVERAKRVADEDPELAQEVREGRVSVTAADEQIKARQTTPKRRAPEPHVVGVIRNVIERLGPISSVLDTLDLDELRGTECPKEWKEVIVGVQRHLRKLNNRLEATDGQ